MRPIYGCPENFRDSLTMLTATFLNFMGFCSDGTVSIGHRYILFIYQHWFAQNFGLQFRVGLRTPILGKGRP